MKQYRETFNDGFLQYGYKVTERSPTGKRIGDSFVPDGKLAYKLMSAREQDHQLAGTMNSRLDLKVKTLLPPSMESMKRKSNLKALIDQTEYDVITIDRDKTRRYLFFYLQEVGGFDGE
jgi:hypothetical protein